MKAGTARLPKQVFVMHDYLSGFEGGFGRVLSGIVGRRARRPETRKGPDGVARHQVPSTVTRNVAASGRFDVPHEAVHFATQALQKTYGHRIQGHVVDLSASDAHSKMANLLLDIDILVNNAGAIPGGGLDVIDNERWRKAWDLKVYGYINTIREVLPKMVERKSGVIVNIIGMAGAAPSYDYVCGSMANASLITFTKAVGGYSSKSGVRVLGVNPGPTETDRLIKLYKSVLNINWVMRVSGVIYYLIYLLEGLQNQKKLPI